MFLDNPAHRGPWADRLRGAWASHRLGEYMPVTWMSYGLDRSLWDIAASGYHLTSLLLHAMTALAVMALASRFIRHSLGRRRGTDARACGSERWSRRCPLRCTPFEWRPWPGSARAGRCSEGCSWSSRSSSTCSDASGRGLRDESPRPGSRAPWCSLPQGAARPGHRAGLAPGAGRPGRLSPPAPWRRAGSLARTARLAGVDREGRLCAACLPHRAHGVPGARRRGRRLLAIRLRARHRSHLGRLQPRVLRPEDAPSPGDSVPTIRCRTPRIPWFPPSCSVSR